MTDKTRNQGTYEKCHSEDLCLSVTWLGDAARFLENICQSHSNCDRTSVQAQPQPPPDPFLAQLLKDAAANLDPASFEKLLRDNFGRIKTTPAGARKKPKSK